MNSDQAKSLVRSVLLGLGAGAGGGWLMSQFGIGMEEWQAIVGGLMAVVSVVWSQLFHAKNG